MSTPLDAWSRSLDAVLTRDSNGHHGVSAGDADGDGLDDLYVAQPAGLPNRLFRARGDGTFEDVTDRAGVGVLDDTAQSLFADIDNDGDQDLVLATGTQPLLFVNDGKGTFAPVAGAFTFDKPLQGLLTGLSMADYDCDGFLDVYLCVYSYFFGAGEEKAGTPMPYYDARNGPPGVLFRNDGKGRFLDATKATGLDAGNDRYHFAAAWADYDEDGWPDLLVANDFGVKNLYRNLGARGGPVRFEDVAEQAGVLDHGAGMSAAFLDYDNDGRLDIYTGNMWTAHGQRVTASPAFMPEAPADVRARYRQHARGNGLYRNLGNGRFEDVSVKARANMGRWAWSSDSLDFDSDGFDDLYVANGMLTRTATDVEGFFWRQVVAQSPLTPVKGTPYDEAWRAINQWLIHDSIAGRQRNVLLRNDGKGGFDDVSGTVGLDLEQDGRSFAVLDADRDGDPDLAIMAARQAPQLRLFRNDYSARGRTFTLRLTGSGKSNRDAIGARVVVETDRMKKTRVVTAGSGFLSQHAKTLIVGLGDSTGIRSVTVTWPSGAVQTFTDAKLDTRARLTEGGRLESEALAPASAAPATAPAAPAPVDPPDSAWLYEPFPAPAFSVSDVAGQTRSLSALAGKPSLLLFWSATDAAGRAAVDALARGRDAIERSRRRRARHRHARRPGRRGAGSAARRGRDGDCRTGRPRDGLRARQPPPVHEPPGSAVADRVPDRWRRAHRQGLPRIDRRGARRRGCRRHRGADSGSAAVARRAVPRHVPLTAVAAQLPPLRPRADGPGPRSGGGRRIRAGGAGEPERVDAVPPGHAAREERRARPGAGGLRTRARPSA